LILLEKKAGSVYPSNGTVKSLAQANSAMLERFTDLNYTLNSMVVVVKVPQGVRLTTEQRKAAVERASEPPLFRGEGRARPEPRPVGADKTVKVHHELAAAILSKFPRN
jgi:hypothetical protein